MQMRKLALTALVMLAVGAALAVACGGEEIVEVEKVVVQTVIVEKQVEKKVVETVIVREAG